MNYTLQYQAEALPPDTAAESPHVDAFEPTHQRPLRPPDPWRMYWLPIMGDYDPTMLTLPNAPEPIHPENYPMAVYLPNPPRVRQAWQFPIMLPTDYEGLLTDEAAHPETTRQMVVEVPPRRRLRQYQPPMSTEDPANALAEEDVPNQFGYDLPRLPIRQQRHKQPPPIDDSYFIPATPGDPATYPNQFQMRGQPHGLTRRPMRNEWLLLDAWSPEQFIHPGMPLPSPRVDQPQRSPIQTGDTAPQYFEDQQIIGWQVPLSLPVRPGRRFQDMLDAGEVSGETIDLSLAEPSSWQPNAPSLLNQPRQPVLPEMGRFVGDLGSEIDADGWLAPAAEHQPKTPRTVSNDRTPWPLFVEITSANTGFLDAMPAPPSAAERRQMPQLPGDEMEPPSGLGEFPHVDFAGPLSLPVRQPRAVNQQPIGSYFHEPEIVILTAAWESRPIVPAARKQPLRQPMETAVYDRSALAPASTSILPMAILPARTRTTNAVTAAPNIPLPLDPLNVASDFLAMPVQQRALGRAQPNTIQLVIVPDAAPAPAIIGPMSTTRPRDKLKAAQPTPLRFTTDQQYFSEAVMPDGYESRPAMPQSRRKPLPQAIAETPTESPASFQVLAGLDSMPVLPLRAQPRQQTRPDLLPEPPLLTVLVGFDSMDAGAAIDRRRKVPQPQQAFVVDQQYFSEAIKPASYEASWFIPHQRTKPQPEPIESASTTMFLVGGNPPTFAGSGAFVVVAGAVYSLTPTAGKLTGANRGI